MKTVYALLLIIFLLPLTGCQNTKEYAVDVAAVTSSLLRMDVQYDALSDYVTNKLPNVSGPERQQLSQLNTDLMQLREGVRSLVKESGGIGQALVKVEQVRQLYNSARFSYLQARKIVTSKSGSIDGFMLSRLRSFDAQAVRLDQVIQKILNSPGQSDITQAVTDALTIGAAAAKLIMELQ